MIGSEGTSYDQAPSPEMEHKRPIDWVSVEALPSVEYLQPTNDPSPVLELLADTAAEASSEYVKLEEIKTLNPEWNIVSMNRVGIDFELVASDARSQASDKFRHVIRMGGSFDLERSGKTPREFEAYAVEAMGLDASLYFHGAEQARRMDRLMTMQQYVHTRLFVDVILAHGPTHKTLAVLGKILETMPSFTALDVKKGVLCGLIHDYGEAMLGVDVPQEFKNDPGYISYEAGACVDFAQSLHFPNGSPALVEHLDNRVNQEQTNINFDGPERAAISMYLDPREITNAIFGTEQLHHGKVKRGEGFAAIEKLEYVLSGERAFEAVEYNFQDIASNPVIAQNLLRLGVSTFFRSLRPLMDFGEKYVYVYDFLRQNSSVIDHYLETVSKEILVRDGVISPRDLPDVFHGIDPFINYPAEGSVSETISRVEARNRFLETAVAWREWKQKDHLVKSVWETYFGTTHEFTTNNPDVSFLHKTARHIVDADNGKVAVIKELEDMWGVGLDPESQAIHEAKALEAA